MHKNGKYINQDLTLRWNKTSTQQQDQHWNTGATEIQQLNPGGLDQRQGALLGYSYSFDLWFRIQPGFIVYNKCIIWYKLDHHTEFFIF